MPTMPKGGFSPGTQPTGSNTKGPTMARRPLGGAKPAMPTSAGTVRNYGGDKAEYLGHFRSPENMKRGHNQGAPGGPTPKMSTPFPAPGGIAAPPTGGARVKPTFNPLTNPIAATRQQNRADVAAAKLAGGGALKATRQQNRADLREAINVRQSRNKLGLGKSDAAALKASRGAARTENRAVAQSARATKQSAVQSAKENLKTSTAGVRQARQALRGAIRGKARGAGIGSLM